MSLATDQQLRAWGKAKVRGLTTGKRSDAGRKPLAVLPQSLQVLRPTAGRLEAGGAASTKEQDACVRRD